MGHTLEHSGQGILPQHCRQLLYEAKQYDSRIQYGKGVICRESVAGDLYPLCWRGSWGEGEGKGRESISCMPIPSA